MTWVKKLKYTWQPQEHPGLIVGDIVEFPGNIEKLVKDGDVQLCDEYGNEVSAYDTLGWITDRELEEFKAWKSNQRQQAMKSSLEGEHDTLLKEAETLKAERAKEIVAPQHVQTEEEVREELELKKKEFGAKMAKARSEAAAKRATQKQATGGIV